MEYRKPAITNVMEGKSAIQGSMDKSIPLYVDANPASGNTATSPAYEADE